MSARPGSQGEEQNFKKAGLGIGQRAECREVRGARTPEYSGFQSGRMSALEQGLIRVQAIAPENLPDLAKMAAAPPSSPPGAAEAIVLREIVAVLANDSIRRANFRLRSPSPRL